MLKQKGNSLVWVIVLVLVVAGLAYWVSQKANEPVAPKNQETVTEKTEIPGKTLKIGVILGLSGDIAIVGEDEIDGIKIAVDEINAQGGVNGKQIELIVEDGKCDSEGGASAGNKLINIEGVKFIIGGTCSGETLGFATLAEEKQVIVLAPSATSPSLTEAGNFIFRTAPSDALAGVVAAQYAFNDLGAKTAAVIYETTDYAQGLEKTFKEEFIALGGEVLVDEAYATGDRDFTGQVLKVKNENPDVVYLIPQTPAPGHLVVSQLRSNEVTTQILTAEVMASDEVIAENPKDTEGLIAIEPYFDQASAKSAALFIEFEKRNGSASAFPFYTASAYSDVYLLAEAVEAVGYDTTKVAEYLTALTNWTGALGTISFDKNGDVLTSYLIKKAVNSAFEQVKITTP